MPTVIPLLKYLVPAPLALFGRPAQEHLLGNFSWQHSLLSMQDPFLCPVLIQTQPARIMADFVGQLHLLSQNREDPTHDESSLAHKETAEGLNRELFGWIRSRGEEQLPERLSRIDLLGENHSFPAKEHLEFSTQRHKGKSHTDQGCSGRVHTRHRSTQHSEWNTKKSVHKFTWVILASLKFSPITKAAVPQLDSSTLSVFSMPTSSMPPSFTHTWFSLQLCPLNNGFQPRRRIKIA